MIITFRAQLTIRHINKFITLILHPSQYKYYIKKIQNKCYVLVF